MTVLDSPRDSLIALSTLCEPGDVELAALIGERGATDALREILHGDGRQRLAAIAATRLRGRSVEALVETTLAGAAACGARPVLPEDDAWPRQVNDLAHVHDESDDRTAPPLCLWVRGRHAPADVLARSVAIVGARACTSYGRHAATELAYGLASAGWTVVSGGAYGVDAAAHAGALAADGVTVGVLACGVDRPYPAGNTNLLTRIGDTGLLVSEWPPGSVPQRHRFLVRNRVIAAATAGVVVVEAALRSGARQTARRAWELDRVVMVVPGPITSVASAGVHQLARGPGEVRVVTRAAEIIEDVGRIGSDLAPPLVAEERPRDAMDPVTARVLDAVPRAGGADAATIAAQAGVTTVDVGRALPLLLARELVRRHGDRYLLTGP